MKISVLIIYSFLNHIYLNSVLKCITKLNIWHGYQRVWEDNIENI